MKFLPKSIIQRDDASHKKGNIGHVETWYYDAMLNRGYSMAIVTNVFYMSHFSVVLSGQCIYKDGVLLNEISKRNSYSRFSSSEIEPLICLNDQKIIHGRIDKETKKWIYDIFMREDNYGIDLEFTKTSKAWQGKTFLGNWLAIPRFSVKGDIFVNGNSINVLGIGYHDHNIYPMYAPLKIKGYHFGKIHGEFYTITWACIINNKNKKQKLVVLNNNQEFVSIDPEDITYTVEKQEIEHKKEIPIIFRIKVESDQLYLNVIAESKIYHHTGIPSVNYWRHHVKYTGDIKINSKTSKIDIIDISEYLKFF